MASSSGLPAFSWEVETVGLFTEAELAAADQLVQLSGGRGDEGAASPSSSSSSPRSVNTCARSAAWDGHEQEMVAVTLAAAGPPSEELDRRAAKRYSLLSDLYAATRPATTGACLGAATASNARKRKQHGEADATARYGDQSWYG